MVFPCRPRAVPWGLMMTNQNTLKGGLTNMAIINGKAFWASVQEPRDNKFTGIPQYEMAIALSDAEVEKLRTEDAVIFSKIKDDAKNQNGGGKYLKVKLPVRTQKGKVNEPPRVVDAAKAPFTDLIGNGSEVNVIVRSFETPMGGGMRLQAVQVVKLVSYAKSEEFDSIGDAAESANVDENDENLPF